MLSEKIKTRVANATVKLQTIGGQGVLVKPGFIITAAHCLKIDPGRIAMLIWDEQGYEFQEQIKTVDGKLLKVGLYAYEPVNDIAILGSLNGQAFPDEEEGFDDFCEKVRPVSLFLDRLKYYQGFPIYVYTHEGTWIKGTATNWDIRKVQPTIGIDTEMDIKGGTSGSPIINEQGQLVAIMSNAGGPKGITRKGTAPRPHLALPVWISRIIQKGYFEHDHLSRKEIEEIRERMMKERRLIP